MTNVKAYHLFISHAWKWDDDYYRLKALFTRADGFVWRDHSMPERAPGVDPDTETGRAVLTEALHGQIKPANCVVIISDMYWRDSYAIEKEIELASAYKKPVVGIALRDHIVPDVVREAARVVVGWDPALIVRAVRESAV
jgi:hypothetical protein